MTALSEGNNPLTDRERDVLRAARTGATIAEIANALFLSQGTVRNHLSAAIHKLNVQNGSKPPAAPTKKAGSRTGAILVWADSMSAQGDAPTIAKPSWPERPTRESVDAEFVSELVHT